MKPLAQAEIDYLEHLYLHSTRGTWTARRGELISDDYPRRYHLVEAEKLTEVEKEGVYYGGRLIAETVRSQVDGELLAMLHNKLPRILAQLRSTLPGRSIAALESDQ